MMPCAGLTVRAIAVEALKLPEVPVIVTVALPAAVLLAVSVNTLVSAVGFGLNDAVTPLGKPETDRVTFLANPFEPITEMIDWLEAP